MENTSRYITQQFDRLAAFAEKSKVMSQLREQFDIPENGLSYARPSSKEASPEEVAYAKALGRFSQDKIENDPEWTAWADNNLLIKRLPNMRKIAKDPAYDYINSQLAKILKDHGVIGLRGLEFLNGCLLYGEQYKHSGYRLPIEIREYEAVLYVSVRITEFTTAQDIKELWVREVKTCFKDKVVVEKSQSKRDPIVRLHEHTDGSHEIHLYLSNYISMPKALALYRTAIRPMQQEHLLGLKAYKRASNDATHAKKMLAIRLLKTKTAKEIANTELDELGLTPNDIWLIANHEKKKLQNN